MNYQGNLLPHLLPVSECQPLQSHTLSLQLKLQAAGLWWCVNFMSACQSLKQNFQQLISFCCYCWKPPSASASSSSPLLSSSRSPPHTIHSWPFSLSLSLSFLLVRSLSLSEEGVIDWPVRLRWEVCSQCGGGLHLSQRQSIATPLLPFKAPHSCRQTGGGRKSGVSSEGRMGGWERGWRCTSWFSFSLSTLFLLVGRSVEDDHKKRFTSWKAAETIEGDVAPTKGQALALASTDS